MTDIVSLDEGYSTTRLLTQEKPQIINTPEDKFETVLFLPEGENRKGEGGLRTKGYFKKSYDDKPLISIITVVFNGEKYLEETIQSVINQTYSNVEYIIIDGGSTDGTLDIIKKYEDKIDYWVSEKDEGISDGFNKGIKLSKGKILGIINSDDEYIKNIFETISDIFKEKDIDYLYGDMILEDEEGNIIKEIKPDLKSKSIYGGMPFGHPTLFIKRKLYDKYGYFNNNYKIAMDFELYTRIYKKKSYYLSKNIAKYKRGGVSDINYLLGHKEVLAATLACKDSNFFRSLFEYFYRISRTFIRKILEG